MLQVRVGYVPAVDDSTAYDETTETQAAGALALAQLHDAGLGVLNASAR